MASALMAVFLSEYDKEPVDVLQVIKMVLIHDLVESMQETLICTTKPEMVRKRQENRKRRNGSSTFFPEIRQKSCFNCGRNLRIVKHRNPSLRITLGPGFSQVLLNDATEGRAWREHDVCIDQIMSKMSIPVRDLMYSGRIFRKFLRKI